MTDTRWKQRFDNFDRAFVLLREARDPGIDSLSQLEREGAIQRFEFAFELAWKTLEDYMEENGMLVTPAFPRNVIKEAFKARLIDDGQVWIDMMLDRNRLSHRYNSEIFNEVLRRLSERYFAAFDRLHDFSSIEVSRNEGSRTEPSGNQDDPRRSPSRSNSSGGDAFRLPRQTDPSSGIGCRSCFGRYRR